MVKITKDWRVQKKISKLIMCITTIIIIPLIFIIIINQFKRAFFVGEIYFTSAVFPATSPLTGTDSANRTRCKTVDAIHFTFSCACVQHLRGGSGDRR